MNKKWILIGLVLALVLGIFFLFRDNHGTNKKATTDTPLVEFENIDIKEDKNGEPIWRIKADHVTMSQDKNNIEMQGVMAYFIKDGNRMEVKADKGKVDRKEQKVYLEGNIHGKNGDGLEVTAENLTYKGDTQILSTDKTFAATKDNHVLTADSFEGDRVLQKLTAKGHAKLSEKEDKN